MAMNEKLSALMDGELTEFETRRLMEEINRDSTLRATWERYQLTRTALRNELVGPPEVSLAGRVANRLATEPDSVIRHGKVIRYAGSLAIAASVAAVSILAVQWLQQPEPARTAAALVRTADSAKTRQSVAVTGTTRWSTDQPETERTLNSYLVEHNEFAATGVGGLLPYVRVVGYDREK